MHRSKVLSGWAAVAVLAACGGGLMGGKPAAASCAATLTWRGAPYTGLGGEGLRLPAAGAAVAPDAVIPPCNDTNNSAERATRETARRVKGVDPAPALYQAHALFLVDGAFTTLPGHPLHRALWGSASEPRQARDLRRCRLRGRVTGAGTDQFGMTGAGGGEPVQVTVDAGSSIAGARLRGGQPFLARGDAVDVHARRCSADATRVTAVTIKVM